MSQKRPPKAQESRVSRIDKREGRRAKALQRNLKRRKSAAPKPPKD